MAINNVQFTVATHILTVLGYHHGNSVTSGILAESVNAEPTFIRRTVSRLAKAGLLIATRGAKGSCSLARPPNEITLLDIYRASLAPPTFSIHQYPIEYACPISSNIKGCMGDVLADAQAGFEERLANRTLADTVAAIRELEKMTTTAEPITNTAAMNPMLNWIPSPLNDSHDATDNFTTHD